MSDFELQLSKRRCRTALGMESIDFQTDNFGSQLEAIFHGMEDFINERSDKHPDAIRVELHKSDFPKILSETVFKRIGIKLKPNFNTWSMGCIMPFFINENHILLDKNWRGNLGRELPDQQKIIKGLAGKKGTIDLKNARMGGFFSEYEHGMWMDVTGHILQFKTSVPEMVAILLHEIGHAFTYYELANRLEETNQILANLSAEIRGKNNPETKKVLFKELTVSFGLKDDEFDDLIEETNQTILGLKFFKRYIGIVKSQLPNSKYNETSSEQVADNFATRFGYGRHLITGLHNIHTQFASPEVNEDNARMSYLVEILILHLGPLAALLSVFIIGVTPAAILMPLLWVFIFSFSGDDSEDMTYDRLKMRYMRIRQQYIEMIQKLNLDKEQLRKVVDDVHFIDEIIKNTSIYRTLFSKMANFVFSKSKEVKRDVELQYLLEELTHSDLFLKSAELTVIS